MKDRREAGVWEAPYNDRNGPGPGDARQLSATGGDAIMRAFQAARRAILRCQNPDGYQVPPDKYEWWKDAVITFDPTQGREG